MVIVLFLSRRHHRLRGGQTVKPTRDEIFVLVWELQLELHAVDGRVIVTPAAVT